jgi:hypothetical protein
MFLDREPYIRLWRPTYRVFGPLIRKVKALFTALTPGRTADQLASLQALVAKLSADQELLCSTLGQVAATVAAIDRQLHALATEQLPTLATKQQLAEKHDQLTAQNLAQWTAIENLLVSFMANSSRTEGFLNMAMDSQENHRDAVARKAAI